MYTPIVIAFLKTAELAILREYRSSTLNFDVLFGGLHLFYCTEGGPDDDEEEESDS